MSKTDYVEQGLKSLLRLIKTADPNHQPSAEVLRTYLSLLEQKQRPTLDALKVLLERVESLETARNADLIMQGGRKVDRVRNRFRQKATP